MAENNYGQTRWSANQTGKRIGACLSSISATISEHYKDIIVLFCFQSTPEITIVFTSSYTTLCWQ